MAFWKKHICLMLALAALFTAVAVPAYAAEDPEDLPEAMISSSSSMSFGAEEGISAEEEPVTPETQPNTYYPGDDYDEPAPLPVGEIRNDVPLYYQTDYPDVPYSDGTVATSGCSMASIAMVAAYLRQEEWSPADLARRFGNYEASNIQRMESAATVLDLPYRVEYDWYEVLDALCRGRVAIIMVDNRTQFTGTQHFLVLTGIDSEGKIFVNDSYGPNYLKGELKDGYESGFDQNMILPGFGGAWIFDDYIPKEKQESRYEGVTLLEEEKYLLAKIIWLEARGESFEGQQAIAEIVLNRLVSDRFPDTIRDVIYAEGQFSTVKFLDTAKPGELQYKAIECAMYQKSVLPMDVFYFGRTARTTKVWGKIGGHIFCYCEE